MGIRWESTWESSGKMGIGVGFPGAEPVLVSLEPGFKLSLAVAAWVCRPNARGNLTPNPRPHLPRIALICRPIQQPQPLRIPRSPRRLRERSEQLLRAIGPERHLHLEIHPDRTREMFARVVVFASMLVHARESDTTVRGQWPQDERRGKGERLLQFPFGTIVRRRRRFMQRHLTEQSSRHRLSAARSVACGEFERARSEPPRVFDMADE